MAQKGALVVCGDAGEALGDSIYEARLYVRGSVDLARRRLRREGAARRSTPPSCARCSTVPASTPARRSSAATAARGSSTRSTSTTRGRTDDELGAARVGDVRPPHDRRDPARGARGDLRHPRLGREAPRPALRRPAVPRRERLALSARGLPRALRHRRRARRPLRLRAAAPADPDHDRGDELRRALRAGQGGARPRRDRDGDGDDDRRRRHDRGGARALRDARLPAPPVALRDEPGRPAALRRDRDRDRPGRQAGRRRDAAGPEDLRPRGGDARPAEGRRPALGLPAPGLDRARTTSRSRSASCARSPTGRSRSSSRSARRARTTTSRSR